MKGWVGLVGCPIADGLSTYFPCPSSTCSRKRKVHRPKTDVLRLCHKPTMESHIQPCTHTHTLTQTTSISVSTVKQGPLMRSVRNVQPDTHLLPRHSAANRLFHGTMKIHIKQNSAARHEILRSAENRRPQSSVRHNNPNPNLNPNHKPNPIPNTNLTLNLTYTHLLHCNWTQWKQPRKCHVSESHTDDNIFGTVDTAQAG